MSPAIARVQSRVLPILRAHGVIRAGVFGSQAREEAGSESDLDLLVEFEQGRTLFDLAGLQQALEDRLHTSVDVVTYGSLHPLLREQVLTEEIRIL